MITRMVTFIKSALLLIRPHQWIKNLLIFVPPFFGGIFLADSSVFLKMAQAFLAFSLFSSAGYIVNDILDMRSDRLHPQKRFRPLASGAIGIYQASLLLVVILTLSLILSLRFAYGFLFVCVLYLALSVAYSLFLQHIVILDALSIALGFVFRIEAGGVASEIRVSSWLVLTTFLLSLLLAFGKRRFELLAFSMSTPFRRVLAEYKMNFLDTVLSIFATTAIVTYSIYVVERGSKGFLITVPFACYGVLRYVYIVQTNSGGDPTEALFKDRNLLICVVLWIIITALIIYLQDILGLFNKWL